MHSGLGSVWSYRLRWLVLALPAFILGGCGSVPSTPTVAVPAGVSRPAIARNSSQADCNLPSLPAAGSGRGGYYQDDGPGDLPLGCLRDLPDAIPRIEPYSKTGNKPYVVFGQRYEPITDDRPLVQRGVGSWYGKKFHGQKTSSGELYDMYQMTAAHPTLPIPSYARVTNLKNGAQVIVRVNDRGPFRSERIIDLSYTAALKLGYLGHGSSQLQVERLLPDEILRMANATPAAKPAVANVAVPVGAQVAGPLVAAATDNNPPQLASIDALLHSLPNQPSALEATAKPVTISDNAAIASSYYVQLGAYTQAANAEALRSQLTQIQPDLPALEVVQNGALFRVHSGPFQSRAAAQDVVQELQRAGITKPLIVQR